MLYKAEIREYASKRMLRYFIPITIIATPLGQITGDRVSTDIVVAVGGVLVTFVAVFEIYQKRDFFASLLCRNFKNHAEKNPDPEVIMEIDKSEHGHEGHRVKKNPDAQVLMETEGADYICADEIASLFALDATVGENAEVAVEMNRESEASIGIEDFASLFNVDATGSENAKVAVESDIPRRESEASLSIDDFASQFDLDATVSESLL